MEGEARDVGGVHAAIAREIALHGLFTRPCVLLSGGETTITVREKGGKGGRNGEFAFAADTDGIDGSGSRDIC
ncbi:MOFRL family protein [Agrobacterium rosae]|uniref:MOFRL family protein n=1 Tax=Agrobacterium rosae TaxID=1972867 RepID=UPI003BA2F013